MKQNNFPSIPDKKYFTIREASELCGLKAHTLRYWEKEFNSLSPITRKGNRRSYRKEDLFIIRKIKSLLYEEGLTISGAKKKLSTKTFIKENSSEDQIIIDLEKILKTIKKVV